MAKKSDFKESIQIPQFQSQLQKQLLDFLDIYQKNNSFKNREYLCYLVSAIFLTYRNLYPQLSLYILFRTKGDISFIKNIQKEFKKFINSPNTSKFESEAVLKDISGARIVLDNIDTTHPPTPESTLLFNDPKIQLLQKNAEDNLQFIKKVDTYINSSIHSGKEFFELDIELIKRIINITPTEFTDERAPYSSYAQLLETAQHNYDYFSENENSFPTIIIDDDLTQLTTLLNELRLRIYDQLQFEILRITLPIVLNSPLVKQVLQTSSEFDKERKKANAFQSIYNKIRTPFGEIELQGQSGKAYLMATKGSAYHSGLKGKSVNVKDFFELANPNDEHSLNYYLDILDSVSADALVSPLEIPEFSTEFERELYFKTPKGKQYLESENYRKLITHIRIRDTVGVLPPYLPKAVYDSKKPETIDEKKLQQFIDEGKIKLTYLDTNPYLISTLLSIAPYMNVCSSGHSSFTTVAIHHKKILGEISESLRKKDSNTVLRNLLITRIEEILDNPKQYNIDPFAIEVIKKHDEDTLKLPKDISEKNIFAYAQKLRNKSEQSK